jgi:hypothetical protein
MRGGGFGRYGSRTGVGRRRACTREEVAMAASIGLGMKTTGRGPHVSERGDWLAGLKTGTGPTQERRKSFSNFI